MPLSRSIPPGEVTLLPGKHRPAKTITFLWEKNLPRGVGEVFLSFSDTGRCWMMSWVGSEEVNDVPILKPEFMHPQLTPCKQKGGKEKMGL